MYYRLHTDGADNVYMDKEVGLNSHVELGMGRVWDEIELPYRFTMSVVKGELPRFYGWYPGSDLMQERLVEALKSVGVDNLQTFPAKIRREITNEEVPGYVVVNVVGRVACADIDQSETEPLADVYYFHNLVINPKRTEGLIVFRVHESPMIVLVHEKVAKAIEGKFLGLTFEPVTEKPSG